MTTTKSWPYARKGVVYCPECDSPVYLRERRDKSSRFGSCSGYPRNGCRYSCTENSYHMAVQIEDKRRESAAQPSAPRQQASSSRPPVAQVNRAALDDDYAPPPRDEDFPSDLVQVDPDDIPF